MRDQSRAGELWKFKTFKCLNHGSPKISMFSAATVSTNRHPVSHSLTIGIVIALSRNFKEGEVYYRCYESPLRAQSCCAEFRQLYNQMRPLWALRPAETAVPWTPAEVYEQGCPVILPYKQGRAKVLQNRLEERLKITNGERHLA